MGGSSRADCAKRSLDRALADFELSAERAQCRSGHSLSANGLLLFGGELYDVAFPDLHSVAAEHIANRVAPYLVPGRELVGGRAASIFTDHRLDDIGGQRVAGWGRLSQSWRSQDAPRRDQEFFEFSSSARLFAIVSQQPDKIPGERKLLSELCHVGRRFVVVPLCSPERSSTVGPTFLHLIHQVREYVDTQLVSEMLLAIDRRLTHGV